MIKSAKGFGNDPSSRNATTGLRSSTGSGLPFSDSHICPKDREARIEVHGNPKSDKPQHPLIKAHAPGTFSCPFSAPKAKEAGHDHEEERHEYDPQHRAREHRHGLVG